MKSDLLDALLTANLAAAGAVVLILILRRPARSVFGARLAYGLWILVPAAMLATLVPARTLVLPAPTAIIQTTPGGEYAVLEAAEAALVDVAPAREPDNITRALIAVWLAGVTFSLARLAYGQRRAVAQFGKITRDAQDRRIGRAAPSTTPALLGVFKPRIVIPADFETRFERDEQALILAHERAHMAAAHPLTNLAIAMVKGFNWFNPLLHVAAQRIRIDQELACDAAVIADFPGQRGTYARALVKSQLNAIPIPLGCYWPGRTHPQLLERVGMLQSKVPSRLRLIVGAAAIGVLATGASIAAWAAQAPQVVKAPPARAGAPVQPPASTAALATGSQPQVSAAPDTGLCLTNACKDASMTTGPRMSRPFRQR